MNASDFKNLDPRDIPNWPLAPQMIVLLVIVIAVIVGGYFLVWNTQMEEIATAKGREETLKAEYKTKKAQAVNLELYKAQLKEIQQSFSGLLKQLPRKSEVDQLLQDINQAGVQRGLQFLLFKPDATEKKTENYAELPITLSIVGGYHDLAAFTSDVSRLSRIVTLGELKLEKKNKEDPVIIMSAVAKTYRYLEDDEAVAMKQQAAADKSKRK